VVTHTFLFAYMNILYQFMFLTINIAQVIWYVILKKTFEQLIYFYRQAESVVDTLDHC
jgi:hypothetical protein